MRYSQADSHPLAYSFTNDALKTRVQGQTTGRENESIVDATGPHDTWQIHPEVLITKFC